MHMPCRVQGAGAPEREVKRTELRRVKTIYIGKGDWISGGYKPFVGYRNKEGEGERREREKKCQLKIVIYRVGRRSPQKRNIEARTANQLFSN